MPMPNGGVQPSGWQIAVLLVIWQSASMAQSLSGQLPYGSGVPGWTQLYAACPAATQSAEVRQHAVAPYPDGVP